MGTPVTGFAMDSLRARLEALDPPVKSFLEWRADGWLVCLVDPSVPAMVYRVIEWSVMNDLGQTNMIILYAVNELRRKGSNLPLEADTALLARGL